MLMAMIDPLPIFGALGDLTRLRILALLRRMELSVGELAQVLGQSQPRVSRHVKIMVDAGLAERRKEGSWVFVALGAAAVVQPVIDAPPRRRPGSRAMPTNGMRSARSTSPKARSRRRWPRCWATSRSTR